MTHINTAQKPKTKRKPGRKAVITPQRKQLILDFIHEFRRKKEISPTYEQIAVGIGYKGNSEGTIYTYINELIAEGWLKRVGGVRSVVPTRKPEEQYANVKEPELKAIQRNILRRL